MFGQVAVAFRRRDHGHTLAQEVVCSKTELKLMVGDLGYSQRSVQVSVHSLSRHQKSDNRAFPGEISSLILPEITKCVGLISEKL